MEAIAFPEGSEVGAPTGLMRRYIELTKVPVDQFSLCDLRVMIGQQFGLPYLIPIALEKLQHDVFADAELYEGDLLENVLRIKSSFWDHQEALWRQLDGLIKNKRQEIVARKLSLANFDHCKFKGL